MIKTSYINPFSSDAKEIVSKLGQVETLDEKNQPLLNIVNHTRSQLLDDDTKIPRTLKQLALLRFEWYLLKKLRILMKKDMNTFLIQRYMNMM